MYFRSKYGPVLTTIIVSAMIIQTIPGVLLGLWWFLFSAVIDILIAWIFFGVGYYFAEDMLVIKGGPFRCRILYRDIKSIYPTRNPVSSPASSIDRLEIVYNQSGSICVSPKDKEGFLKAVRERCPYALISDKLQVTSDKFN